MLAYILLTAALYRTDVPEARVINAKWIDQTWTIPVEIEGLKPGYMMLGTASCESKLSVGYSQRAFGETVKDVLNARIGSIEVNGAFTLSPGFRFSGDLENPGVIGLLGSDLWENAIIGLDTEKAKWSFWKPGALKSDQAKEWVLQSTPWSDQSIRTVLEIPCEIKDNILFIKVQVDGQFVETGVNMCFHTSYLSPGLAKSVDSLPIYSRSEFLMDGSKRSQRIYIAKNRTLPFPSSLIVFAQKWEEYESSERSESFLGNEMFTFRRWLLDAKRGVLLVERQDADEALSADLSKVLRVPVKVENGRLFVGPQWLWPAPVLADKQNKGISVIGGKKATEVRRLFSTGSTSELKEWLSSIQLGFDVIIQLDDGDFTLHVKNNGG